LARDLSNAGSAELSLQSIEQLDGRFDHLVADVRIMITHMGDTSNLILDPDLDSYYLMDVTLLALPQTQDRLARASRYGYDALRRGGPTPEEKIQLAVYAAMLQEADVDRVSGSSRTSVNEDAGFYGTSPTLQARLPAALLQYEQANGPFIRVMKSLSRENEAAVSPEAYLRSGQAAWEQRFSYWNTAISEEDALLRLRIAHFEQRRSRSLLLALVAVLAASLVAFWLTRSITRPLLGLVSSLTPGAILLSVCVERISQASENNLSNREEADLICQELDANCDAMRKAVAELETQVKGTTHPQQVR
jgi:methyl-accepting chemotaxis protein